MPKVRIPEGTQQADVSINTGVSRRYELLTEKGNVRHWGVITDIRHGWRPGATGDWYYIQPQVRLFNEQRTELGLDRIKIGWYDVASDEIINKDPSDNRTPFLPPYFWTISALGFHNGEGSVTAENSEEFMYRVLPTKQADPEGEHTPEIALAGALVYVSVVPLPFTRQDGSEGIRNAIGFNVKPYNGRHYANGGWMVPQVDRLVEWQEKEPALVEAFELDNWVQSGTLLFQGQRDLDRYEEMVAAGPVADFDNDPATAFNEDENLFA